MINEGVQIFNIVFRLQFVPVSKWSSLVPDLKSRKLHITKDKVNSHYILVSGHHAVFDSQKIFYHKTSDLKFSIHYQYVPFWRIQNDLVGGRQICNYTLVVSSVGVDNSYKRGTGQPRQQSRVVKEISRIVNRKSERSERTCKM